MDRFLFYATPILLFAILLVSLCMLNRLPPEMKFTTESQVGTCVVTSVDVLDPILASVVNDKNHYGETE